MGLVLVIEELAFCCSSLSRNLPSVAHPYRGTYLLLLILIEELTFCCSSLSRNLPSVAHPYRGTYLLLLILIEELTFCCSSLSRNLPSVAHPYRGTCLLLLIFSGLKNILVLFCARVISMVYCCCQTFRRKRVEHFTLHYMTTLPWKESGTLHPTRIHHTPARKWNTSPPPPPPPPHCITTLLWQESGTLHPSLHHTDLRYTAMTSFYLN